MAIWRLNEEKNGVEIVFDKKPANEVLDKVKAMGFGWHGRDKYWYAKQTPERIEFAKKIAEITAETGAEVVETVAEAPKTTDTSDWGGEFSKGYMGATRWDGKNSHKSLYGADLSKAIREDLKAHGVKGVTIANHSYANGQSITATCKPKDKDIIPYDEWQKRIKFITDVCKDWVPVNEGDEDNPRWGNIHIEKFYTLDADEQKRIFEDCKKLEYERLQRLNDVSYRLEDDKLPFTGEFIRKLSMVKACIDSYNYDDSNSMVDYFDTNFYYSIKTYTSR